MTFCKTIERTNIDSQRLFEHSIPWYNTQTSSDPALSRPFILSLFECLVYNLSRDQNQKGLSNVLSDFIWSNGQGNRTDSVPASCYNKEDEMAERPKGYGMTAELQEKVRGAVRGAVVFDCTRL